VEGAYTIQQMTNKCFAGHAQQQRKVRRTRILRAYFPHELPTCQKKYADKHTQRINQTHINTSYEHAKKKNADKHTQRINQTHISTRPPSTTATLSNQTLFI
jgi:hypothetical protein